MGKSGKLIVAIIVVLVLAGGAFLLANKNSYKTPTSQSTTSSSSMATPDVTITYDGNGFSLSAKTIKSGGTVKVVNTSNQDMNFDSDPHPVHTDDPELNAGDIPAGESKTFTVTTKGTWGFHNHLNPSQHGQITVE